MSSFTKLGGCSQHAEVHNHSPVASHIHSVSRNRADFHDFISQKTLTENLGQEISFTPGLRSGKSVNSSGRSCSFALSRPRPVSSERYFWQGSSVFCFSFTHLSNGNILTSSIKVPNANPHIILWKYTQGNFLDLNVCICKGEGPTAGTLFYRTTSFI